MSGDLVALSVIGITVTLIGGLIYLTVGVDTFYSGYTDGRLNAKYPGAGHVLTREETGRIYRNWGGFYRAGHAYGRNRTSEARF